MQSVTGRRSRRSAVQQYQQQEQRANGGSSAARSRSHHRQHQCRRAALVMTASRPYDASKQNGKRSGKKQQQQQQQNSSMQAVGPAVTMLKTGAVGVITTTAPASPNSSVGDTGNTTTMAASHSGSSSYECHQATHVGDHSYTRPKGRYSMNELGVQTPSDSEEEIDVVSIGDKNLPTNPTARNRRHLESEVASKIRTASSRSPHGALHYDHQRHHAGGASHYHHRQPTPQQHPDEGLLGVASAVSSVSVRGQQHLYPTPAGSTTISGANTPLPSGSGCVSAASSPPPPVVGAMGRRRLPGGGGSSAGGKRGAAGGSGGGASKRMRHGHGSKRSSGAGSVAVTATVAALDASAHPADEQDTAEKRNLHNNMERQRRIGLKNLFEELKRQIPSLRDKDRAPKVNILREAAVLCTRLSRESDQVQELRQRQKKLYERVRQLRSSMHTQRQQPNNPHQIVTSID